MGLHPTVGEVKIWYTAIHLINILYSYGDNVIDCHICNITCSHRSKLILKAKARIPLLYQTRTVLHTFLLTFVFLDAEPLPLVFSRRLHEEREERPQAEDLHELVTVVAARRARRGVIQHL